jgi:hypothetical protein
MFGSGPKGFVAARHPDDDDDDDDSDTVVWWKSLYFFHSSAFPFSFYLYGQLAFTHTTASVLFCSVDFCYKYGCCVDVDWN